MLFVSFFFFLNSLSIPPGTKISLTGTITVKENILMLDSNNTKVLGGEVEKLKEKWELNKVSIIYYDFLVGKVVYCVYCNQPADIQYLSVQVHPHLKKSYHSVTYM